MASGVIWLTGLADTGKTTVARELAHQFARRGRQPIVLDGDEIRSALGATGAYDRDSRKRMALTYARLCRMLAANGHLVIMATISLFHDVHRWNREHLPRYFEVLLDVPIDELRKRDTKGLYTPRTERKVVGVGQQAEFPTNPDLVIPNHGEVDPETAAAAIRRNYFQKEARS